MLLTLLYSNTYDFFKSVHKNRKKKNKIVTKMVSPYWDYFENMINNYFRNNKTWDFINTPN